jgi:hypothetical protein
MLGKHIPPVVDMCADIIFISFRIQEELLQLPAFSVTFGVMVFGGDRGTTAFGARHKRFAAR